MRKSIRAIAKELSIHLVIIASALGLAYWYLSPSGERKAMVAPSKRVYHSDTLRLEPLVDYEWPARAFDKSKPLDSVLRVYRSVATGGEIRLVQQGKRAVFLSGSAGGSLQSSGHEIPNLEPYDGELDKIALACDGQYLESGGVITYSCYHLPLVYLFDQEGKAMSYINTIDQVAYPALRRHSGRVTLEQGHAHNSNRVSFVREGVVYVISEQVSSHDPYITLDCYQLSSGEYMHSLRVKGDEALSNFDVSAIRQEGERLVLLTPLGIYSLFS